MEDEEEEDEELDVELEREICEVESTFGGEGVRALTSTTFRLITDRDDAIAGEVRATAETSGDAAGGSKADVLVTPPVGIALLLRGDEDRERGTTSTTFKLDDEEDDEDDDVDDEDDGVLDIYVVMNATVR